VKVILIIDIIKKK